MLSKWKAEIFICCDIITPIICWNDTHTTKHTSVNDPLQLIERFILNFESSPSIIDWFWWKLVIIMDKQICRSKFLPRFLWSCMQHPPTSIQQCTVPLAFLYQPWIPYSVFLEVWLYIVGYWPHFIESDIPWKPILCIYS